AHFAALLHVGEASLADHLLHRALDLRLVPAQEPLAIDRAFAAAVRTAIDEGKHRHSRGQSRPVTTTCARADTTRPAGAPASPCSPWRPCARQNSGASASRRRKPWH